MMVLPAAFFGMAMGMNIPTLQTLLVGCAPTEYRAAFMSVNGMVLRLGQTLGPLIIGMAFTFRGINGAFMAGVLVALLMGIVVITMIKGRNPGH